MIIRSVVFIVALALPGLAECSTYYATHAARRGSELRRLVSASRFLAEQNVDCVPCSIGLILSDENGANVSSLLSKRIAEIISLHEREVAVLLRLPRQKNSNQSPRRVSSKALMKILRVNRKGVIISNNPVWNACIQNEQLTALFVKSNTDGVMHRQARKRVFRPYSCRDYHRGDLRIWRYPDDSSIELVLDKRGRLLGDPPVGYILQKVETK